MDILVSSSVGTGIGKMLVTSILGRQLGHAGRAVAARSGFSQRSN